MIQLYLPYPSVHFWIYRNYSNNWINPRFFPGVGCFGRVIQALHKLQEMHDGSLTADILTLHVSMSACNSGKKWHHGQHWHLENYGKCTTKKKAPMRVDQKSAPELVDFFVGWCVFIWFPTIQQWGWTYQCVRDSKGGSSMIPGHVSWMYVCNVYSVYTWLYTPIFSYHVLEVRTFCVWFVSMSHQTCNLPQRKQDIVLIKNIFNERFFDVKKNSGGVMRSCFLNYNSSRWDVMPLRIMRLGSWLPWLVGGRISLAEFIIPKTPKTKHRPKRKNTHVFQHLPAIGSSSTIFQSVSCQEFLLLVVMIQIHAVNKQWHIFHPVVLLLKFLRTYHTRSL